MERRYLGTQHRLVKRRHCVFYRALRILIKPFVRWRFRYSSPIYKDIPSPALILSNHATDYDPIFLGVSFPAHMYFVASEHTLRWGFLSRLLKYVFSPVPRLKGTTDARTAIDTMRLLRSGKSVCIFAEGNRTFDGLTGEILPSTGKLAKKCGVPLITFRLQGGYFSSPRWAYSLRKGKITGRLVSQYSTEELRNMDDDKVNALIKRDLYEDAYKSQALSPVPYRGKRLAEKLEHILYLCPVCGGWETFSSHDNRVTCGACGHSVTYTEWGMLAGGQFDTVTKWNDWQKEQLTARLQDRDQSFSLSDSNQSLFRVIPYQKSEETASGELFMDRAVLRLGLFSVAISDIQDMAILGKKTLTFSAADKLQYEIKSNAPLNAVKYLAAYKILKGMM